MLSPSSPGLKAKHLDRWRKPQAVDRFTSDAAAYAHDYLYLQGAESSLTARRTPIRGFRLCACEIYNAGVERLIRAALTKGQIQLQNGEAIPLKVVGREQSLRIVLQESPLWNQADIHKILFVLQISR